MEIEEKIEFIKKYREVNKWYGPDNLVWCTYCDFKTGKYYEIEEDIDQLYDEIQSELKCEFREMFWKHWN